MPAGDGVEVVHSTAIPPDNPERAAARERGLPDLPRAELLAQLSALKRTIAIAGAHGKTTTTSMAAHVLLRCGLEPAYLIGGALTTTGLNADWGAGEWLVVEADESDRSMLSLHVDVAVVTNVELDHHATYGSLAEVREVFRALLAGAPQAVLWDRPDVLALRGDAPHVAFDVPAPDARRGGSSFEWRGHAVRLAVPGAHNARNAAAALEAVRAGRRRPRGGRRGAGRLRGRRAALPGPGHHEQRRARDRRLRPSPDRGGRHHRRRPHAGAAAGGRGLPASPVLAHAAARARLRRRAGRGPTCAAVLDVYPARERAEDFPGVTGLLVAEAAADAAGGRPVLWLPTFDAAEPVLRGLLRDGDLCLVLGAGDVDELGRRLVADVR